MGSEQIFLLLGVIVYYVEPQKWVLDASLSVPEMLNDERQPFLRVAVCVTLVEFGLRVLGAAGSRRDL